MANIRKVIASVVNIKKISGKIFIVDFRVDSSYTRFKPGQFLHLSLSDYDPSIGYWPESRVFSIASVPKEDIISIIYSIKGAYTKLMSESLKIGLEVWLKYPYGNFIIEQNIKKNQDIVLIAGGTGIAPYLPFLKNNLSNDIKIKKILFYGALNIDILLYYEELSKISEDNDSFKAYFFLEEKDLLKSNIRLGRLSIEAIISKCKYLEDPVYFISGPDVMVKKFKKQLLKSNVSNKNIKIDEWE